VDQQDRLDQTGDLNDLADVNITGATNGQGLVYQNGIWVNGDIELELYEEGSFGIRLVSHKFYNTLTLVRNE